MLTADLQRWIQQFDEASNLSKDTSLEDHFKNYLCRQKFSKTGSVLLNHLLFLLLDTLEKTMFHKTNAK